eukprot:TRINITY_DN27283_c0_g1_i1.p1 TRINITY_DN27283_c0_g1~~TRINITY_DN27283_c0_g1_i1.p1  ORF type:complete len:757 (+),score=228.47 TRINITY_DN27283_c0_g1_i1:148-2418(+)
MHCQFTFRLDHDISSLLQDNIRELSKGRFEKELDLNRIGAVQCRYDNRMPRLHPVPVDVVQENGRSLPDWREFKWQERAWWHQKWPYAPPVVEEEIAEMSVQSDERSEVPERARPQRCALVCRAAGTVSPVRTIIQKELEEEELMELSRRAQVDVLKSLVGPSLVSLPKADDEFLRRNILGRPITYVIATKDYYPLVPSDALTARYDLRFARCVYHLAVKPCPRGVLCPFVHSPSPTKENFRRIVLKIVARVRWANGRGKPVWPPPAPPVALPAVEPWVWEDKQDLHMPQWVMAKPDGVDPLGYTLSLAAEIEKFPHITRFELRRCALTRETLPVLCRALRSVKALKELSLRYCDLTDETVPLLLDFLDGNQTLRGLNLAFNNIGPAGVDVLVTGILSCQGLRKFVLHGNPVGDHGVHHLHRLLQVHDHLTSLSLACTMISNESFHVLGRMILTNTTLTTLSLDGTSPTLSGCMTLYNALKQNRTLTDISMRCVKAATAMFLWNVQEILARNAELRKARQGSVGPAESCVSSDPLSGVTESDPIPDVAPSPPGSSASNSPMRTPHFAPTTPVFTPQRPRLRGGDSVDSFSDVGSAASGRGPRPRKRSTRSSRPREYHRPVAPNQTVATHTLTGSDAELEPFRFMGLRQARSRQTSRRASTVRFEASEAEVLHSLRPADSTAVQPLSPRMSLDERRRRSWHEEVDRKLSQSEASPLVGRLKGRLNQVLKQKKRESLAAQALAGGRVSLGSLSTPLRE